MRSLLFCLESRADVGNPWALEDSAMLKAILGDGDDVSIISRG